ncbi:MAG: hypothetical protein Q7S02_02705 [bacterium]|nr:hypothetical protein [bacterium]
MVDIEHQLKKLPKATLAPDRDARIRAALMAWDGARTSPIDAIPSHWGIRMRQYFTFRTFAFATAVSVVAVIGVSGYAYASPTVTRGDALYGVKRTMERVQGSWQVTPLDRVEFHGQLALRRTAELEVLLRERGGAQRLVFVPIARAAASSSGDASAGAGFEIDALRETALEITAETTLAAAAAEEISEPFTAKRATDVVVRVSMQVETRLRVAASATGIGAPSVVVEAVTNALEETRALSVSTAAASVEIATAVERGDRTIRVEIVPRRPVDHLRLPESATTTEATTRARIDAARVAVVAASASLDAVIVRGPGADATHAVTALLRAAKGRVADAESAFTTTAYERASTNAAVATELATRAAARLTVIEHRFEEDERARQEKAPRPTDSSPQAQPQPTEERADTPDRVRSDPEKEQKPRVEVNVNANVGVELRPRVRAEDDSTRGLIIPPKRRDIDVIGSDDVRD